MFTLKNKKWVKHFDGAVRGGHILIIVTGDETQSPDTLTGTVCVLVKSCGASNNSMLKGLKSIHNRLKLLVRLNLRKVWMYISGHCTGHLVLSAGFLAMGGLSLEDCVPRRHINLNEVCV